MSPANKSMPRLLLAACLAGTFALSPQVTGADDNQIVAGWEHCVVDIATWDRLNIRDEPSADGKIVTRLQYGECGIGVTGDCADDWCPVEIGRNEGWANARFIASVSPAMHCMNTNLPEGDTLALRAYPSEHSRIVFAIPSDQCGISDMPYSVAGWQKIRVESEDGTERHEGWIPWGFLMSQ
jgi:hypothetical protein